MDDLLPEFIAETREMLAAIAGEIVAWEADPHDRVRLDAIFRFVHTVKGSCGFLNLTRLQRLSHAAEDVLAAVRAGERTPDAALVTAVLGIVDRIGELTDAMETGESLSDEGDRKLIAALAPGGAPVEAPPPQPAPVRSERKRQAVRTIRLPVDLLDRMMGGVSDMVLARNELARKLRDGGDGTAAFERLSACVAEMRDAITRTRMQRLDNIFATLPRMVRDLSGELGKQVALDVDGGDVELDREMIEMIRDPLMHVVRNAIDHGIETPEERRAAGKPAAGRLSVCARQAGNQILIDVSDDGRGCDGDALVARAIAAGSLTPERAQLLTSAQKVALIFEPGLTTAPAVTAISGRGVGMDVVRANVERIGGLVDVDSRPNQGLRLTLRVPLTLTIIPALTVSAGGQNFAIPRSAIEEIVRAAGEGVRIRPVGGAFLADIRGRQMPVVDLGALIASGAQGERAPSILVLLKPAGGGAFALAVEAVHDHEDLVVKPAAPAVMATGIYAGTTLPDNGRPMLLLDPAGIAALAGVLLYQPLAGAEEAPARETGPALLPTLLFRDLDGMERAIRLAVVERIEDVPASAAQLSGGRLRLSHEGRILPLLSCGEALPHPRLRVLRMSDGAAQIAYAIDEVLDIVPLPASGVRPVAAGPIAGVVLFEGRQVELLDAHWLFADAAAPVAARRPVCLLADDSDPWAHEILAPLIETAGYRVTFGAEGDAVRPDIVIDTGAHASAPSRADMPVLRLRGTPEAEPGEEETIYRYDRAALLGALGRWTGRG